VATLEGLGGSDAPGFSGQEHLAVVV